MNILEKTSGFYHIKLYYIDIDIENDYGYLHSDGIIRKSTLNEYGDYTGYYTTKEHAQLVIEIYNSKNAFNEFLQPKEYKETEG